MTYSISRRVSVAEKIADVDICGQDSLQRAAQGLVRHPEASNSPPGGGRGEHLLPEPSESGDSLEVLGWESQPWREQEEAPNLSLHPSGCPLASPAGGQQGGQRQAVCRSPPPRARHRVAQGGSGGSKEKLSRTGDVVAVSTPPSNRAQLPS